MIDIANQVTQQNAHKTAWCEPYIAAIVGPYSKKLPTCQSSMTWFYVNHPSGRIPAEDENPLQAGCTPMQLQVTALLLRNMAAIPEAVVTHSPALLEHTSVALPRSYAVEGSCIYRAVSVQCKYQVLLDFGAILMLALDTGGTSAIATFRCSAAMSCPIPPPLHLPPSSHRLALFNPRPPIHHCTITEFSTQST